MDGKLCVLLGYFLCSFHVLIVLHAHMGWRCGVTVIESDGDAEVDHGEQDHQGGQYQLLCKQEKSC